MKKFVSLPLAFLFVFAFLCIPEDTTNAFYYKESTTKKLPPYNLVRYDFDRSQKYAIPPSKDYAKVYVPFAPVQYDILRVGDESLVRIPLRRGVATYRAGEIRYWPSWIGVPPWWVN